MTRFIYRVKLKRLDAEPMPPFAHVTIRLGDRILARAHFPTAVTKKDPRYVWHDPAEEGYCFQWDFHGYPVVVLDGVEFSVTVDDPYLRNRFAAVIDSSNP